MAIVQISQIKHRRGLAENGPSNGLQLASAEMGWDIDTQRLYIGNGTLEEGAPEVGNTEVLTQQSDIVVPLITQSQALTTDTTNVALVYSDGPSAGTALTFNSTLANGSPSVNLEYAIVRGADTRSGKLNLSFLGNLAVTDEEYNETANLAVSFVIGQPSSTTANIMVTTANTGAYAGVNASLRFRVTTINL